MPSQEIRRTELGVSDIEEVMEFVVGVGVADKSSLDPKGCKSCTPGGGQCTAPNCGAPSCKNCGGNCKKNKEEE